MSKDNQEPQQTKYGKTKLLIGLLVGLGGIAFGLQIWNSGEVATTGAQIKEYEEEKQILILENARLKEVVNNQSSLEKIQEKAKELGFVKVAPQQLEHILPLESFAIHSTQ